ncbi:MAG: phosphoribosyltransferase family protein [Candidatus Aenigmatarchaeota archaeon]
MNYEYYEKYINKNTKDRFDTTTLFENPKVFSSLVDDLLKPFEKTRFNKIVALDALGFILGGAAAQKLKIGLVPVRKKGKLPGIRGTVLSASFSDYVKKGVLEMNKGSIKKDDSILIVDEWIETGGQIKAAIKLIEKQKGKVVGIATICAHRTPHTEILFKKYNCHALKENRAEGRVCNMMLH